MSCARVWSRNLNNKAAWARIGLCHRKKKSTSTTGWLNLRKSSLHSRRVCKWLGARRYREIWNCLVCQSLTHSPANSEIARYRTSNRSTPPTPPTHTHSITKLHGQERYAEKWQFIYFVDTSNANHTAPSSLICTWVTKEVNETIVIEHGSLPHARTRHDTQFPGQELNPKPPVYGVWTTLSRRHAET